MGSETLHVRTGKQLKSKAIPAAPPSHEKIGLLAGVAALARMLNPNQRDKSLLLDSCGPRRALLWHGASNDAFKSPK
jgi:hypothetical protein